VIGRSDSKPSEGGIDNLVVSPATRRVSQSVQNLVCDTGGTIQRFDPRDRFLYTVPMSDVFFEILSPLPLNRHQDARKLFQLWAENAFNFLPNR
jgi:hypothetical protein